MMQLSKILYNESAQRFYKKKKTNGTFNHSLQSTQRPDDQINVARQQMENPYKMLVSQIRKVAVETNALDSIRLN